MINYRVSKPRRAFICTALALSLAPFLILALVMSDATRASSSGRVARKRAVIPISLPAEERDRQQYGPSVSRDSETKADDNETEINCEMKASVIGEKTILQNKV